MIKSLYKPFQHWSDGGSIWIIGDLHLGDGMCTKYYSNWPTPKRQIELLRKNVTKNDTLLVLGDVGKQFELLNNLNCYKVLIKGNHDSGNSKYETVFDEIYSGPVFIHEKIVLSHEPVVLDFALNIHGHDHTGVYSGNKYKNCINLAANKAGWHPISLRNIIKSGSMSKIKNIHQVYKDNRK